MIIRPIDPRQKYFENIDNVWINKYPFGSYIVTYVHDKQSYTASYIVNQNNKMKIIKFVETNNKNIEEAVPTIKIQFDKKGENTNIGVSNSIEIKNEKEVKNE